MLPDATWTYRNLCQQFYLCNDRWANCANNAVTANSSTAPYGNSDPPFNLPQLVASCGATYVARWTALHIRRLTKSMLRRLIKKDSLC